MGGRNQYGGSKRYGKTNVEQASHLADQFQSVQSVVELLSLLEIEDYELTALLNPQYRAFDIGQEGKSKRKIHQPVGAILSFQRKLLTYLNAGYALKQSDSCYSYTPHLRDGERQPRSNVQGARLHLGQDYILSLDIHNFFSSISREQVVSVFRGPIYNLPASVAEFLAFTTTYKDVLPTGSSSSPVLSNCVLLPFDTAILGSTEYPIYSRYADDLTFSWNGSQSKSVDIVRDVQKILAQFGFKLNSDKTRLRTRHERQIVYGVVVNKKTNLKRSYYRELRAVLHDISSRGLDLASQKYVVKYRYRYAASLMRWNSKLPEGKQFGLGFLDADFPHYRGAFALQSIYRKVQYFSEVRGIKDRLSTKVWQLYRTALQLNGFAPPKNISIPQVDGLGYITNATAKSAVFYAKLFLQKAKGSIDIKYASERYDNSGRIDSELILSDFIFQSDYLLALFRTMNTDNTFERLMSKLGRGASSQSLDSSKRWEGISRSYERRIFHVEINCVYMVKDYVEEVIHANTGILAKNLARTNGYILSRKFLEEIGMRPCQGCNLSKIRRS